MTDVLEKPQAQSQTVTDAAPPANPDDRTLVLVRELDASPEALFRCWAEDHLLKQWFVPKPLDRRPGRTRLPPRRRRRRGHGRPGG